MPGVAPFGRYAFGQFPEYVITVAFYFDTELICTHAENRTMVVSAEDRAMLVSFTSNELEVLSESRSMSAGPRTRVC